MAEDTVEGLLAEKASLAELALARAVDENGAIKAKDFAAAAAKDRLKNDIIDKMMDIDRRLLSLGQGNANASKNTGEAIKNINSSLNNLIKIEKENEILISGHYSHSTGNHINAYKTYKRTE